MAQIRQAEPSRAKQQKQKATLEGGLPNPPSQEVNLLLPGGAGTNGRPARVESGWGNSGLFRGVGRSAERAGPPFCIFVSPSHACGLQLAGRCVRLIFAFPFLFPAPTLGLLRLALQHIRAPTYLGMWVGAVETLVLVFWTILMGFLKGRIGLWVIMEKVGISTQLKARSSLSVADSKSKTKERNRTTDDHYPPAFPPRMIRSVYVQATNALPAMPDPSQGSPNTKQQTPCVGSKAT